MTPPRLDATNRSLLLLFVVGLVLRLYLNIGYALGDDGAYANLVDHILHNGYPEIPQTGQYEYRPLWLLPNCLSKLLFGWGDLSLSFYCLVTGSLIPVISNLWLRIHVGRDSAAPLLCSLILTLHPVMFVDSLMMVNETPMIFFSLLAALLFALGLRAIVPPAGAESAPGKGFSFFALSGLCFACAYQVKITALPITGLLLLAELSLTWLLRKPQPARFPGTGRISLCFAFWLLPSVLVQGFYWWKTGNPIGNYLGENRLYLCWLPPEYMEGNLDLLDVYRQYVEQLFFPYGAKPFECLLHGLWAWLALIGGCIILLFHRRIEPRLRWPLLVFFLCGLAMFLFLEFWPTQLTPYYLPNCFTGRPWRYIDVLAPPIAIFCSLFLTLPWWKRSTLTSSLGTLLSGLCFLVAGYSLVIRHHDMYDRGADFRKARATCLTLLQPYMSLPHYADFDSFTPIRLILDFPPDLSLNGQPSKILDLRKESMACVWTGGSRREGTDDHAAWSANELLIHGGKMTLLYTWDAPRRPWRRECLQLWLYTNKH